MNGSGLQDTARVLQIRSTMVIAELKKHRLLEAVNRPLLVSMETPPTVVMMTWLQPV